MTFKSITTQCDENEKKKSKGVLLWILIPEQTIFKWKLSIWEFDFCCKYSSVYFIQNEIQIYVVLFNMLINSSNFDHLWPILTNSDQFWPIRTNSDQFWSILTNSNQFLPILINSDQIWPILINSDQFWPILVNSG